MIGARAVVAIGLLAAPVAQARAQVAAERDAGRDRAAWVEAAERAATAAEAAARAARAAANAAHAAAGLPATTATVAGSTPPNTSPENQVRPFASAAVAAPSFGGPAITTTAGAIGAGVANGPNDAFLKSSTTPDLQLIASDLEKVASLAWTLDVSGRGRPGTLSADQFTLVASGKFDGEGDTGLLGSNGFAKGTQMKLRYIHYGGRTAFTGRDRPQVVAARIRCEQAAGDPAQCEPYGDPGVGPFVTKWHPADHGPLLDAVLPGPIWFAGVELQGDQATYDYLDRTAFETKSTSRFGFGGSVFGGLLLDRGLTSLTAGYTWRRRLREADTVTLCQLVAGTAQTRCITAADGAPSRDTQSLVTSELRHAFAVPAGRFSTLAVAPTAGYDLDSGAWSVELPVYFADNGEGKLRGGVKFGYLNEGDGSGGRTGSVQAGLFVGVPFSVLSR